MFFEQVAETINKTLHKVTLVAVTKSVRTDETNEVIKAGVKAIGENRVEDFEKKMPDLLPVEKHFIGRIQSRKIPRIVELFDVIQSVGSIEHLILIERAAIAQKKDLKVLLQFNISQEKQKGGFEQSDVERIIEAISTIQHAEIIGVMGIAEDTRDTAIVRRQFQLLKGIGERLRAAHPAITELSMGMSNDYKIALEEGTTMLRIGRALFS